MWGAAVEGRTPDSSVNLEKVECVVVKKCIAVYEQKYKERFSEVTEDISAFSIVSKSVIAIESCFETLS